VSLVKAVKRKEKTRGEELVNALKSQFNILHTNTFYPIPEVEEILVRQKQFELHVLKNPFKVPEGYVKFTPSGASKCKRELFYKAIKAPKVEDNAPFNNRWTRNSSAIHEAVQRDILYFPYIDENTNFKVKMIDKGEFGFLPAWESAIETYKIVEHNGVTFVITGKMDGLLEYTKDGSTIGFEFKTKSTDNQQVHKLNKPAPHHVQQCVAYSILFDIDEFLITYEAVAKDKWNAGATAYEDLKPFYVKVTEEQRIKLLDKFAEVAEAVENGELPEQETSKCLFCPYKHICLGVSK
jgi:CRISPR/Cas system-associated exonuclease Cas4 (RecB family)